MMETTRFERFKNIAIIFFQFFKRDTYVHMQKIWQYVYNYAICFPIINAVSFAYIQANVLFGTDKGSEMGTLLLAGNLIIVLMVFTYKQTIEILFDLEGDRFIDYQISLLPPRLVILERILFTSIFTFLIALPFFPVAKLLLRDYLNTSNTWWLGVIIIIYLGSLCCAAYHQFATLALKKTSQITQLWARVNHILITLGGFWIPLFAVKKYSQWLGYIVQLNPIMYITEGLRQAFIGGEQFLPFWYCVCALLVFTVIFTNLAWWKFKQRTDHI